MVNSSKSEVKRLLEQIILGLEEKKAHDIVTIDIGKGANSVADFFVICHGTSKTQVNALADSVEEVVRKNAEEKPWHVEGRENSEWILMDYVDVVIHIFDESRRDFFKLEELWGDYDIQRITSN